MATVCSSFRHWSSSLSSLPSTVLGVGRHVDHAFDVAGRIEAGTVFVNVHRVGASDVAMEFGGFKQSGLGRGHGWVAVEECSELQVLAHRPGWADATDKPRPSD